MWGRRRGGKENWLKYKMKKKKNIVRARGPGHLITNQPANKQKTKNQQKRHEVEWNRRRVRGRCGGVEIIKNIV